MYEDFYFISGLFQICLVFMLFWCLDNIRNEKLGMIVFMLIASVWLSEGVEYESSPSRNYATERTIVSAQPSHTELEGNFLFFSGVISEERMYLLREEVSEGLYKDFTVKKEVYIREDNSLTDKGKFVQKFSCNKLNIEYKYLAFTIFSKTAEYCKFNRQEIVVPKGSVIKELKI